ncbi:MAG: hypothetical protein ACXVJB_11660, partial [Mucilaginibacter sp.]
MSIFFSITSIFDHKRWVLCFLLLTLFSCKKSGNLVAPKKDTTVTPKPAVFATPSYNPLALDTTRLFDAVPLVHNLARTDLLEISGVAASRLNPGILYIHGDSGNPNQVYLTDGSGANDGTLTLTPVGNRDW